MNITLDTRLVLSPHVMLQEVSGEAVLLDLKGESYFGLNAAGTRIWRLVEQGHDLRAVHAALLHEYDVDPSRLEHDMTDLITRLVQAGLVSAGRTGANEG